MMKDYIVYQMMKDFGADTPLCSFVYITVNGEDWGLYLAVEGVEDSFLQRNYGGESGELYKPDSMSFGGGRGNGKEFSMDAFNESQSSQNNSDAEISSDSGSSDNSVSGSFGGGFGSGNFGGGSFGGQFPGEGSEADSSSSVQKLSTGSVNTAQGGFGGGQGGFGGGQGGFGGGMQPPDGDFDSSQFGSGEMPQMPDGDFDPSQFGSGEMPQMPDGDFDPSQSGDSSQDGGGQGAQPDGGSGMGSDDVKLKYIDDDPDSYSNIFDNAKTDVSNSDKTRLISSLKSLSEYSDLENVLDMDEVLRYFVVHNFVCNGDSYTGSMIHNYYLYEEDGALSMIPWDYNLAFGTFQGGDASSSVNASIDSPVTGGDVDDRPMVGWIFSNEEYTSQYHELFGEFISEWISGGKLQQLITDTAELIRPYVEKDPTKFCTSEEFEAGVTAISKFVELRGEAVSRQLNGDTTAVDTDGLNVSDMGTMGGNMGGDVRGGVSSESENAAPNASAPAESGNGEQPSDSSGQTPPQMPGEEDDENASGMPQMPGEGNSSAGGSAQQPSIPSGGNPSGTTVGSGADGTVTTVILVVVSLAALAFGIVFAIKKKW